MRPGRRRRDAVAGESVPPRRRSPPIAIETDESVARTTPHTDDLCYNDKHEHIQSKEDEHTYVHPCSIQERCKLYFL
jgi:hypothetical protein